MINRCQFKENIKFKAESEETHRTTAKVAWEDLESSPVACNCVWIGKKELEPVSAAPANLGEI